MKFFLRKADEQQREAYRVRLERATLRTSLVRGDSIQPVEMLDMSAGGCAVRAALDLGYEVYPDLEVALRIVADNRNLYTRAVVRSVNAEEVTARIGLQFIERERLWAQLDERLWRFFNRRQAFRIVPARDENGPQRVTLRWGEIERVEVLHDLSTTGLSLRVSVKEEIVFPAEELIRAEFKLPLQGAPFRIGIVLAHDTLVRGSRRVGFRFDPDATPGLSHEQERILQYVLARQRLLLRQKDDESDD